MAHSATGLGWNGGQDTNSVFSLNLTSEYWLCHLWAFCFNSEGCLTQLLTACRWCSCAHSVSICAPWIYFQQLTWSFGNGLVLTVFWNTSGSRQTAVSMETTKERSTHVARSFWFVSPAISFHAHFIHYSFAKWRWQQPRAFQETWVGESERRGNTQRAAAALQDTGRPARDLNTPQKEHVGGLHL